MAEIKTNQSNLHWPSFWQLLLSVVGILLMWTAAFGGLLMAFVEASDSTIQTVDVTSVILLSTGAALGGFLLVPSAGYALLHMLGRSERFQAALIRLRRRLPSQAWLILLVPLAIWLGSLVPKSSQLSWLVLPPLQVIAVGVPIWWLVYLGRRGLEAGSPQRLWGVFAVGLVLGPTIVFIIELGALLVVLLAVILYVSLNPTLAAQLQNLALQLQNSNGSEEQILRLLEPYLRQPIVLFGSLAFVAGVIPLIEELFKPIGVWFLAGSKITPAGGFVAGLISGAGFALYENLAYTTLGVNWSQTVVQRLGTGVLHVATAALTGWALALAWQRGRYLILALAYLVAVGFHGLWNGLAVVTAGVELSGSQIISVEQLGVGVVITLVTMVFIMLIFIVTWNIRLKRTFSNRSNDGFDLETG